jgi:hypothetical protein
MHWTVRFILVALGAGVLTSMTDWLCAGDWIHRRFTYPEIWRTGSETKAIAVSSALPFATCTTAIYLFIHFGDHSFAGALWLAFLLWIVGPLPLTLTNAAFIKLHRVFVVFYSIGWLIKLSIATTAAWLFL